MWSFRGREDPQGSISLFSPEAVDTVVPSRRRSGCFDEKKADGGGDAEHNRRGKNNHNPVSQMGVDLVNIFRIVRVNFGKIGGDCPILL